MEPDPFQKPDLKDLKKYDKTEIKGFKFWKNLAQILT
jgi:hypothetical protein